MVEMNSFTCGDCMDYLPQFPNKYFDIAVVDPLYGKRNMVERTEVNMLSIKMEQKYMFLMGNMKNVIGIMNLQEKNTSTN